MQQRIVDSLKAAREKEHFSGSIAIAMLPRLHDVARPMGAFEYRIEGSMDGPNRPQLRVSIGGMVILECQRCMGDLPHRVQIESLLRLQRNVALDTAAVNDGMCDPEAPDVVEIGPTGELDLVALVEDEVLLALPDFPRHEEGLCSVIAVPDIQSGNEDGDGSDNKIGGPKTAFGVLAALKQK